MSDQEQEVQDFGGIAIVGMAVRVPGASDLETYWRNLSQGVSSVSFFTDEELREAGVDPDLLRDPSYVRARGVPEAVDQFDAGLFGLTPREAETLDPQHRLFLELSWSAFDHAGYDPATYGGAVGVFAGSNVSSYLIYNLVPHRELVRRIGPLQLRIRNDKDFLATQVSYKLNLKGPSVNVQTACSTSLVAVSLACQSLLGYQCDMALAGGVSVSTPPRAGYLYQEGVYASDGICRAFDADAEGTVLGDGATVVLLKRLADALADGDTVHAVIRGFATNNDGSLKLDYTAPSIDGQAEVIATAHAVGDVDPATIGYMEAHGTGTPLGDVIEVAALSQAFAAGTDQKGFCALGSVKTNIGHLDAAAGTASLIKAALALQHRQIPPSLHFHRPNPRLELEKTPFYVSTRLSEWEAPGGGTQPRRAGVSSFGVGGTNAHVVVEEAPELELAEPSARPWQPLVLSARSAEALEEAARRLADHLEAHPEQELADVAYTLQKGRKGFAYRRMLVARDGEEAARLLRGAEPRRVLSSEVHESRLPSVAFLFSGIGDQYVGMARGLYDGEPVFRGQVDAACRILQPLLGLDLREVLFADAPERGKTDLKAMLGRSEAAESPLDRTALLHPALFVVEHAMAQLWISWGIRPEALIGYSLGEYVAACLAGVFPLEVALRLVAERARVIDALPRGAMLAVPLPEADLTPLLGDRLSLAAVNGPAFCVAAGPAEEVAVLEARLGGRGVVCRRLRGTHAFHSTMMEPARDAFLSAAAGVRLAAPSIPFVSNVTGTWITDEQATDPRYWAEHMTRTVRFGEGLETLCRDADRVLVEVGPGSALASVAVQLGVPAVAVPSIPHVHDAEPGRAFLAGALGRLWLSGVRPDWAAYWGEERRRRVPLPAYPFERRRYWIDPPKPGEGAAASADGDADAIPARHADPADWFYAPVWKEAPRPAATARDGGRPWLVLLDGVGLGERLADRLRAQGRQVFTAEAGDRFEDLGGGRFRLAPGSPRDHEALLEAVRARGELPGTVVHLWSLGEISGDLERSQDAGFFSLLALAQAWGHQAGQEDLRLVAVSGGVCDVTGEEPLDPRRSTLTGPCRVLPQENPAVACLHLDLPMTLAGPLDRWAGQVLAEAEGDFREPVVALRGTGGSRRWVEDVQPTPLAGWDPATTRLRERGVYLITGGLGGIGLSLAVALAEKVKARLVLVGRTADATQPEVAERLREAEAKGGEVLVLAADVTRREQMAEARRRAEERFGAVHGVIHAAGVPPGGLIQLKERDTAAAVLAPKVQGTLVLREVFAGAELDFLVLCSSLTALLGAFGLVDHCAANAFLDAYAQRAARDAGDACDGEPVISVAWDSWLEVGQAARAGVSSRLRALLDAPGIAAGPKIHPLLDRAEGDGALQSVFVTRLAARDQWILREHRVQGQGIVPATAFLEMARAAFAHVTGAGGGADGRDVVLSEVVFSHPLLVADGGEREVRTILRPEGSRYELRIVSSAPGEGHATLPQEHVRGWMEGAEPEPAAILTAEAVGEDRDDRRSDLAAALAASGVEFGPRWTGLLRGLRSGGREGWARFELPEEFHAELGDFGLHPALLDAATGIARVLRDGAYLPFSLRRMRIRGPLPAAVQSRFRLPSDAEPAENELAAEVTVFDGGGRPLVEIQGYTLRRIPDLAALRPARLQAMATKAEENDFGLTPSEGAEAFVRLLARGVEGPRVLVSTRELGKLRERFRRRLTREQLEGHLELLRSAGPAHARPSLQTAYVAPRTETEEVLARLFREMLGIDRVGIHDNFFDLGGNSLVATQLLSRLRDELEVDVPLRALFEAPTVAELSRAVVARQAEMVDEEDLAGALAELRQMSREELLARLASESDG